MNKLFVVCAVLVAVAHAAPDLLSGLATPVANAVDAVVDATATTTEIPVAPTTEKTNLSTSEQGTVVDRTKLVAKLFKDYNNKVNPDSVKVKFGVALIDFHVLEDKDAVESNARLRYVWTDARLAWNKEEFGGVSILRIDPKMIWTPDITLYSSADSADTVNMMNCWETNVLVWSNGEILWVPTCKIRSWCHLTLRKEPYGEQVCGMKFGSWTFEGTALDLEIYNGNTTIDLADMHNTSGFEVLSTIAEKKVKFYPCCEYPFPSLFFNMTIKRIPGEELIKKL